MYRKITTEHISLYRETEEENGGRGFFFCEMRFRKVSKFVVQLEIDVKGKIYCVYI